MHTLVSLYATVENVQREFPSLSAWVYKRVNHMPCLYVCRFGIHVVLSMHLCMIMAPVFDGAIDFTLTDVNYWQYGGHFSMN